MVKILIVEDDPLMSRMYQRAFSFDKYDVETASNGKEGLEKVRTGKPALVLLDIMMPEMNGLEMLEKMKADPKTKNIPVVVLTNLSSRLADAEAALSRGAVKYIVKSEHDPKEVSDLVKEILADYTKGEIPKAGKQ